MKSRIRLVAPISRAVDRLAGAISRQMMATGSDDRDKAVAKILDDVLFFAQQPAEVHEEGQLGEIRGLEGQVDDRQADPAAALVELHAKEKRVE